MVDDAQYIIGDLCLALTDYGFCLELHCRQEKYWSLMFGEWWLLNCSFQDTVKAVHLEPLDSRLRKERSSGWCTIICAIRGNIVVLLTTRLVYEALISGLKTVNKTRCFNSRQRWRRCSSGKELWMMDIVDPLTNLCDLSAYIVNLENMKSINVILCVPDLDKFVRRGNTCNRATLPLVTVSTYDSNTWVFHWIEYILLPEISLAALNDTNPSAIPMDSSNSRSSRMGHLNTPDVLFSQYPNLIDALVHQWWVKSDFEMPLKYFVKRCGIGKPWVSHENRVHPSWLSFLLHMWL